MSSIAVDVQEVSPLHIQDGIHHPALCSLHSVACSPWLAVHGFTLLHLSRPHAAQLQIEGR